jgi:hypothetical protein
MKNFKTTVSVLYKPTFEIKAESMEEAERIAQEITPEDIDNASYTQGLVAVLCVETTEEVVEDNRTLEDVKGALDRIVKQYVELSSEFAQYRNECVKWSVEDFLYYEHPTHTITPDRAQIALEYMIGAHDPDKGITWNDVAFCIEMFGTLRDVSSKTPQ